MTTSERVRRSEILAMLTVGDRETPLVERVCEISGQLLNVSGAGMCLVGGSRHEIVVHGTNALAEELEDLQVVLGQGPCIEAVRTGVPVLVPELSTFRTPSWQDFADEAYSRGVRALFTFPLVTDGREFGALDLYRSRPGPLTADQAADAEALTDIATRAMLAQKDRVHPDGTISALRWLTGDRRALPDRGRAVDLGITVEQALAPLWPDEGNDALGSDRG